MGLKSLSSPLSPPPVAPAPHGLLLLNFLVEGALSPVPFLVRSVPTLSLQYHLWLQSTSGLCPAAAAGLRAGFVRCGGSEGHSRSLGPVGVGAASDRPAQGFLHVHFCFLKEREAHSCVLWLSCLSPHPQPLVMPTEAAGAGPCLLYAASVWFLRVVAGIRRGTYPLCGLTGQACGRAAMS